MQRVTGIGGVFLKAHDSKKLAAWYQQHLGIEFGEHLSVDFKWINKENPHATGYTVFSFFKDDSLIFSPPTNFL